jgi:ketosteroid isomerase-like protein
MTGTSAAPGLAVHNLEEVDRVTEAVGQSITHEAVRRYLDGLNALDPGLAVSAYAPTAVIRYPGQAPMGVDEFRAYLEQVKMALADLQIAPREHFETEHGVAAAWTFRATTKAGRTVTCDGIDSWVIGPGGKIESVDVFYDPAPLVEALRD